MRVNFKTLEEFVSQATQYLSQNSEERSIVTFALHQVGRPCMEIVQAESEAFRKKREELEARHCSKDGKGNFLEEKVELQTGRLAFRKKFTEEADRLIDQELIKFKEEQRKKEFDIEVYIVDTPDLFDFHCRRAFEGFIFKPMDKTQELDWYLAQAKKP